MAAADVVAARSVFVDQIHYRGDVTGSPPAGEHADPEGRARCVAGRRVHGR